jgi:hypothetical protein
MALRPEATACRKMALRPEDTGLTGPAGYGVSSSGKASRVQGVVLLVAL